MEIKINKDVNKYREEVLWGLNLRQFIFSIISVVISAVIYVFIYKNLGVEISSWICILAVLPLFAFGFLRWNDLPLEKIAYIYIKQKFIDNKKLVFKSENYYYNLLYKKEEENKTKKKSKERKDDEHS